MAFRNRTPAVSDRQRARCNGPLHSVPPDARLDVFRHGEDWAGVLGEVPAKASDRALVRVLLAGDGRASALDLRRLIAGHPDLVAVGQAVAVHETLEQAQELQPDVVVLDRTLSHDVVLSARELASLDRPPAVVIRAPCPEPVMMIAAILGGVRGIVNRSDSQAVFCDALRWVAANGRWLPDIAPVAVSRAGSRLKRDDLPILLMLLRGSPWSDIAANLGITSASVDARRSAMLRDILGGLPAASGRRGWPATEAAAAVSEAAPRIELAA